MYENAVYPYEKFAKDWFSRSNKLKKRLGSLSDQPQVSIVILVSDNTTQKLVDKSLSSIFGQSFLCSELIIVSRQANEALPQKKPSLARDGNPIKVENLIMDLSLPDIVRQVSGEFLLFLNAGDYLAKHGLLEIAKVIKENNEVSIIYSDDDVVIDYQHVNPHFKPDWNPDLFYSNNYIGCSVVFRSSLLIENKFIGRADNNLDPVYVCLLGILKNAKSHSIKHIPKVLFHLYKNVVGRNSHNLPLLRSFFSETNKLDAKIIKDQVCIQYALPKPNPLVSLLIPTRDQAVVLKACIDSIQLKTSYKNFEIIILNNQSKQPETLLYFDSLKSYSNIRVLTYNKPFNYSAINNYGVQHANGSILGFINNDIEVINPEWLGEMVMQTSRDEIGCVGSKLYYSDGTIQHAGVILGIGGIAGHSHKHIDGNQKGYFSRLISVQNLSAVTAACMLVRKSVFNEVGGFDEKNLTVAYNDVDLCLEVLSKGYRNLWTPYAELYHHESVSRGRDDVKKNAKRFAKERRHMKEKWGELLTADPYYNPNLTMKKQDFSFKKHHLFSSFI